MDELKPMLKPLERAYARKDINDQSRDTLYTLNTCCCCADCGQCLAYLRYYEAGAVHVTLYCKLMCADVYDNYDKDLGNYIDDCSDHRDMDKDEEAPAESGEGE